MKRCILLAELAVLTFAIAQMASAADWYVATNGTGDGTNNWANATNNLQGAIDASSAADIVWVSNGVYETGGVTNYPTDTVLTNRVAIYKVITVRSANNDPTNTIIKGIGTIGPAAVRCVYMTNGSALIGFTLTNGATLAAGNSKDQNGGGVYSPDIITTTISNCIITGNAAKNWGGGANCGSLFNCTLISNSAYNGGGVSDSVLSNCTMRGNVGAWQGGAAHWGTLYNCVLVGNRAGEGAGLYGVRWMFNCTAISNTATRGGASYAAYAVNCIFIANSVEHQGGASYDGILYNCTVVSNSSTDLGGGIAGSTLYNCISWDNNKEDSGITAYYSCGVGYTNGGSVSGNITNNPLFVDSAAGNYRLQASSPCVNVGTNGSWTTSYPYDLDGRQRVRYGTVDMGCYETIYKGTIYRVGF